MVKKDKDMKFYWEQETSEVQEPKKQKMSSGQPFEIHLSFSEQSFPVNISERKDDIIVEAHLPGFKKNEIRLQVIGNMINIQAEKKSAREQRGKNFYIQEAGSQSINRSLSLPSEVTDVTETKLEDGVPVVKLKKADGKKKKRKLFELQ